MAKQQSVAEKVMMVGITIPTQTPTGYMVTCYKCTRKFVVGDNTPCRGDIQVLDSKLPGTTVTRIPGMWVTCRNCGEEKFIGMPAYATSG